MVTRRSLFTGGIAATLASVFPNSWDKASFPAWPDSFVDKILTDSPWAHQCTVPFRFRPLQGGTPDGVATEIYLTTRWASALPVRQALALHQYGVDRLQEPKVAEWIDHTPDDFIIEAAGFPVGMIPQGARKFEAELAASCALVIKGRPRLAPLAVSVPEHGNHLIATIRFPRLQNLTEADGVVAFSGYSGPMTFSQKFRLRDMFYRGRLEL